VITLKKVLPSFGAQRIKENYSLSISEKSIRKIWKEEGLLKMKRKRHKTKQNLREIKAKWRLFEQMCIDTNDLQDIPELWSQIRALRLPKIQYTAREVTSGMLFIGYAEERTLIYAELFVRRIIEHLKA